MATTCTFMALTLSTINKQGDRARPSGCVLHFTMNEAQQIQIKRFSNGAWWFLSADDQEFRVSSINNHSMQKLQALYTENEGQAYITLEKITEYPSDDYRCKVSRVSSQGWRDDDVYCLVTNETGNLNPNAERDIARADAVLKFLGIS